MASNTEKKLLLVDDDPGLLRLLSMRLNAAGYEIVTAASGEQALAQLPAIQPGLVVTDLRMDGMDGMALFDIIHRRNPTLPVIILTAHGTIPDAVEATRRGVFGYLTKPFDSRVLLDYVARALQVGGRDAPEHPHAWRSDIVSRSAAMEALLDQVQRIAASDAAVLIQGESGTGKELLARAIHTAGARHDRPFLAVSCGAIPENLLDSELFGHRRGAFPGAEEDRRGALQVADGGTLFLGEVGDIPLASQAKLLRALQKKEVRPVGASAAVTVDARLISATHSDLEQATASRQFREDLYYRLAAVTLKVPPLRERREDIPLLALRFLKMLQTRGQGEARNFSPEAMELLVSAPWPGNAHQLRNVVEQAVLLSSGPLIPASLVQKALHEKPPEVCSFTQARAHFERDYLAQLLQITEGNVTRAARLARRNRTQFYKLLRRHHLDPHLYRQAG